MWHLIVVLLADAVGHLCPRRGWLKLEDADHHIAWHMPCTYAMQCDGQHLPLSTTLYCCPANKQVSASTKWHSMLHTPQMHALVAHLPIVYAARTAAFSFVVLSVAVHLM